MIFISERQHSAFVKFLDESIHKLEKDDGGACDVMHALLELKDDMAELAAVYFEYHQSVEQLRTLVTQYQQVQKKARVKLRGLQLTYLRQLKTLSAKPSFTKTHKPIL